MYFLVFKTTLRLSTSKDTDDVASRQCVYLSEVDPVVVFVVEGALQVSGELGWVNVLLQGFQ